MGEAQNLEGGVDSLHREALTRGTLTPNTIPTLAALSPQGRPGRPGPGPHIEVGSHARAGLIKVSLHAHVRLEIWRAGEVQNLEGSEAGPSRTRSSH